MTASWTISTDTDTTIWYTIAAAATDPVFISTAAPKPSDPAPTGCLFQEFPTQTQPADPNVIAYQDALKLWNVDDTLNLVTLAADFYLLYDLSLDERDEGRFAPLLAMLTEQFVHYTDMIIGGEVRHVRSCWNGTTKLPKELTAAFFGTKEESASRPIAWMKWKDFRAEHGVNALDMAITTFKSYRRDQFGGQRWANITETLWLYETGELTSLMFVDFCWGLQHNGGTYFNKVWTDNVATVLDWNLHGWVRRLADECASEEVRELYRRQSK